MVAGDDGILTRMAERFAITLRTFPDRPELPLIAAALQDQFRAVGVELEVSVSNYSVIPEGHQDGSLHVALFARNYGLTPDPIGTVLADFGQGGGDWGAMNWENTGVAEALGKIAATSDPDLRAANIPTVVEALHTELPMIPDCLVPAHGSHRKRSGGRGDRSSRTQLWSEQDQMVRPSRDKWLLGSNCGARRSGPYGGGGRWGCQLCHDAGAARGRRLPDRRRAIWLLT